MRRPFLTLLLFAACSSAGHTTTFEVEIDTPAVLEGRLIEAVGIETLGGVFTPLLEPGCQVPCQATFTFSTAADNQAEIAVTLLRGTGKLASENHRLGTFAITGLPSAPRGEPQVAITVRAEASRLLLLASELSGAPVQLQRRSE